MIRNWYNQIPYPALKNKREIIKYINWQQFTKGTLGKRNEQLFPRQVVIQLQVPPWNVQYKNTGGLKPVLRDLNVAINFSYGSKHIVSCNVRL